MYCQKDKNKKCTEELGRITCRIHEDMISDKIPTSRYEMLNNMNKNKKK